MNGFTYSTDCTDDGICYSKRYYHSAWGRFITRDPAQESGGLNLYGFTGNNGVNRIDYLGLSALVNGHTMEPYGTECTREEVDMGDRVMVTTDCNDGSAPFTEFFNKQNPGGGGDTFGGDGGITIDTGGLPGIVVTPNTGGDSTVVVQDENPGNPTKDLEQLKQDCEGLVLQMAAIGNQFAAQTSTPKPSNPMSAGELFGDIERRGMDNLAGVVDAVMASSPAGSVWSMIGFAASTYTADQTISSDPSALRAGVAGVAYGASASGFVDSVSKATNGRAILTQTGRTVVRRAGFVGVAAVGIDVLGVPLIQYADRNSAPRSNHPAWVRSQWESVIAPTLNALTRVYNDKGCGEVLGGH